VKVGGAYRREWAETCLIGRLQRVQSFDWQASVGGDSKWVGIGGHRHLIGRHQWAETLIYRHLWVKTPDRQTSVGRNF
jgi:hypothetical protein